MTEREQKIRIQTIIVISCVIFAVLMLAALATNLIRLAAYKSRLKKLEAAIAELDRAITANSSEIDYKKTDEYIDRYAREYLDMQDENDVTFKEEE